MTTQATHLSQKILGSYLRLSDYEARVYDLLVREGPSTAMKISVLSNVPRTKIYKTLNKLVDMGVVSEVPLKPKHYIALPPKEALKPILEAHKAAQRGLYALISNLQRRYERTMSLTNVIREEFWILTGTEVLEKASRFISQVEKKIIVFASNLDVFFRFYSLFGEALGSLVERRVSVDLYFSAGLTVDHRSLSCMGLYCRFVNDFISIPSQLILLSLDHKYAAACLLIDGELFFPESSIIWIVFKGRTFCRLIERLLLKGSIKPSLPIKAHS
ncbi:MAG: hypothetical protein N3E47_01160 [Candidatus Bathyarchaeota archaeon]|nr:hypothetical protein [Candidatus Bathyarchaeota archaeon]